MRKRYKYVIYSKIKGEDNWVFVTKEKEFRTKTEAVDYLIKRSEEDITNYQLDLDDVKIDGLSYTNLKTNTKTFVQAELID